MRTATEKRPPEPNQWFDASMSELHSDRALGACAEFQVMLWEEATGGPYADGGDRFLNKVALVPQAKTMLRQLMALPDDDRRALAHRLWPTNRNR